MAVVWSDTSNGNDYRAALVCRKLCPLTFSLPIIYYLVVGIELHSFRCRRCEWMETTSTNFFFFILFFFFFSPCFILCQWHLLYQDSSLCRPDIGRSVRHVRPYERSHSFKYYIILRDLVPDIRTFMYAPFTSTDSSGYFFKNRRRGRIGYWYKIWCTHQVTLIVAT